MKIKEIKYLRGWGLGCGGWGRVCVGAMGRTPTPTPRIHNPQSPIPSIKIII